MRIQKIDLNLISLEKTLRKDYDFHSYNLQTSQNYVKFDELFIVDSSKIDCSTLDEPFEYCEIGNVTKEGDCFPVLLDLSKKIIEYEDYYKKIENGDIISVSQNDILLSKVRPNLKKFVRIRGDNENYFFTSAFIKLIPKQMPIILYYCFKTIFYNDLMAIARQGKGYPTINEKDLKTLKFNRDIINKLRSNEQQLSKDICKIEEEIEVKKNQVKPIKIIIDKVFGDFFNFDYKKFNELKQIKAYAMNNVVFSDNPDLRCSVKFHRPSGEFVENELRRISKNRIKHYLVEPMILGASISPNDWSDDDEYRYISMATIKNWEYDNESAGTVSKTYAEQKKEKTVKKNDIILARSGEGTIGKVALIEDDINAIFCDFTIRIRLKNYNARFAYYYMRTSYFQYLIETYKKGLGNNTNIFPIIIQEFPLPDITLEDQQKIVDYIENEINKQNNIRNEISKLRNKINSLIEKIIFSN